ncbi:hypothetical protein A0257_15875 [Hymenobacter psoromatis]|nr:hypothetical protein A0257_15875 [Hymenobacter psoromatis]
MVAVAGLCLAGTRLVMQRHLRAETTGLPPVNAVVGDASYLARFGEARTAATPDFVRTQAHLAYAEQQLRRARLLDLPHTYWQAGGFPGNEVPSADGPLASGTSFFVTRRF